MDAVSLGSGAKKSKKEKAKDKQKIRLICAMCGLSDTESEFPTDSLGNSTGKGCIVCKEYTVRLFPGKSFDDVLVIFHAQDESGEVARSCHTGFVRLWPERKNAALFYPAAGVAKTEVTSQGLS